MGSQAFVVKSGFKVYVVASVRDSHVPRFHAPPFLQNLKIGLAKRNYFSVPASNVGTEILSVSCAKFVWRLTQCVRSMLLNSYFVCTAVFSHLCGYTIAQH